MLQEYWKLPRGPRQGFGWVANRYAGEQGLINLQQCATVHFAENEPWTYKVPGVDKYLLDDLDLKKKEKEAADLLSAFTFWVSRQYTNYVKIYTDGSKDPQQHTSGAAVCIPDRQMTKVCRVSDYLGVYSVELLAVLLALEWVEQKPMSNVLICSDSLAVLNSLTSFGSSRLDILYNILQIY